MLFNSKNAQDVLFKSKHFLKSSIPTFLFLVIPLLVACTQRQQTQEQEATNGQQATQNKATEKIFTYCSEGSPSTLNPQMASDGSSFTATRPIYNRLFDYENGTTNMIPSLLEKWDEKKGVTPDGLQYTFELKKDVSFHTTPYFTPTRTLNADDIIFSFKRQIDPKHPYHKVNGGIYQYANSTGINNIIKDIVKIDEHKVKFILSQPNAVFTAFLAMDFAAIFSKEYADELLEAKTPEKIDNQPIGTGPFVLNEYIKDNLIRYKAHPHYFDQKGNIDTLIFAITTDASVRLQKLKNNECQLMTYPDPADLNTIKNDKNLTLLEAQGMNVGYLTINVKKEPFDNKLVRQALNHALNKEAYIASIYLGHAQKASNMLPPTIWGYHDHLKKYEYSVEKAKALLKKAGISDGFETDLWTLPVARPYLPSGRRLGEMMQIDLSKIGIRVKLVTFDWPTYLDKTTRGEHTLAHHGWTADVPDPDNYFDILLSCAAVDGGLNRSRWCHKPYSALVTQAREITHRQKRIELYRKAQEIYKEESPTIPIAHAQLYRGMRKNISGYKISPLGQDIFTYIDIE